MRALVACGVVCSAGCGFSTPRVPIDGDPGDQGGPVGGCGFSSQVNTCELVFGGDLTLTSSVTYDTDTASFNTPGITFTHRVFTLNGIEVDAILSRKVVINDGIVLRAVGERPLAIMASGQVFLGNGAVIDVSNNGAGVQPACATPPSDGSNGLGGGAGGGGGSFGGGGGNGGAGNNNGTRSTGGMGGSSINFPGGPQGGCPGGRGGSGDVLPGEGDGGAGGAGGGAMYIAAGDRIDLGTSAALSAGGGGGAGGSRPDSGGGGGGSGGMIFLEAPHVMAPAAMLLANGGGGGEGGDIDSNGGAGQAGQPSSTRALGGRGSAGDGADGGGGGSRGDGTRDAPSGEDVMVVQDGGGGGGGGGVGIIRIASPDKQLSQNVSPAPQ